LANNELPAGGNDCIPSTVRRPDSLEMTQTKTVWWLTANTGGWGEQLGMSAVWSAEAAAHWLLPHGYTETYTAITRLPATLNNAWTIGLTDYSGYSPSPCNPLTTG